MRRWPRRAGVALLVAWAAYLLLGNLYLNTPLGPWSLNRQPARFQIHWSRGLTLWPGQVTLWTLAMKGQARRTVWSLRADRAGGRISLPALWHKRLRMPQVRARGVAGGIWRASSDLAPAPPRADGWVLDFPHIVGDQVRGGRFDDWNLEGDGTARFGFVKQLRGGALEVLPSQVEFRQARLRRQEDEWLRDARLSLGLAIARHVRAQASGLDGLRLADARLRVDGAVSGVELALDDHGKVFARMLPGQGRLRGELALARGQLVPGARLQGTLPVIGVDAGGHRHAGELALGLDSDATGLRLRAVLPPRSGGPLSLDARARLEGATLPLRDFGATLLPRLSGRVAGRWHFASLEWLTRFFADAPWLALDGAGEVVADVTVEHGALAAGSRVEVPRVEAAATVFGNRIRGRASALGQLRPDARGAPLPQLDILMQQYRVAAVDAPGQPYIEGENLRLALSGGRDLAGLRDTLKARLAFDNARVPDLRAWNRYLPNAQMRFAGGSGVMAARLALDAAGNVGSGSVNVRGRGAGLHAAGIALHGDVDIDLKLRRADLARYRFDIAGSRVRLRNARFAGPDGKGRKGWWTTVELPRAQLEWDRRIAVDGNVRATMRDVGFVLDLFSRQRDYPAWIYRLVDAGQARVQGRANWHGDTLVFDRLQARNDRYELLGRLRLRDRQAHGDLYARWGVLGTALELRGDRRRLHVAHARDWYDAQPPLLP